MVYFDTAEIVIIVGAVLASAAAITLVCLRTENPWIQMVFDVLLEIGFGVMLGVNILQFSDDTEIFFRKRLKVAIGVVYVSALFNVLAFVLSTVAALILGPKNKTAKKFARTLSGLAWCLYLIIAIGSFIAYMTVQEETDKLQNGVGEDAIFYLVGVPMVTAVLILGWHLLACCKHRSFKWKITKYHPRFMKTMIIIFAILLATSPILRDTQKEEGDVDFAGAIAMYSELLGAFLHRYGLRPEAEETGGVENDPEAQKPAERSIPYNSKIDTIPQ